MWIRAFCFNTNSSFDSSSLLSASLALLFAALPVVIPCSHVQPTTFTKDTQKHRNSYAVERNIMERSGIASRVTCVTSHQILNCIHFETENSAILSMLETPNTEHAVVVFVYYFRTVSPFYRNWDPNTEVVLQICSRMSVLCVWFQKLR